MIYIFNFLPRTSDTSWLNMYIQTSSIIPFEWLKSAALWTPVKNRRIFTVWLLISTFHVVAVAWFMQPEFEHFTAFVCRL